MVALPGAAVKCHRVPGPGWSWASAVAGGAPYPPPRAPLTLSGLRLLVPRWAPVGQSRLPCDLGPLGWVQDGLGRTSRDSEGERKSGAQEAGQALGPRSPAGASHLCGLHHCPSAYCPPLCTRPGGGHWGWPKCNAVYSEQGARGSTRWALSPHPPAPHPDSAAPSGWWWPMFGPCPGCSGVRVILLFRKGEGR